MKIELEINENDFDLAWEDNASIKVIHQSKSLIQIEANKEGLISLGKQLLTLAYTRDGTMDIHLWAEMGSDKDYIYGDLDAGSLQLSIAKIEKQGRKN